MDLGLSERVALITASSRGIGRAIAEELAAEGARVILASRDRSALDAAVAAIQTDGGRASAIEVDLTDWRSVDRLVEQAEALVGPLDILVTSSAGPASAPFASQSDADWMAAFDVKLMAQIRPCRAVLPRMLARGGGRIVLISGTHGQFPHAYAMSAGVVNAGLLNLTKALAEEGAPGGVLVNAVNPGPVRTDRIRYLIDQRATQHGLTIEEAEAQMVGELLVKRLAEPHEIAGAVAFLVSKRASFITGTLLNVDGGSIRTL